jgi:hypothetical protein
MGKKLAIKGHQTRGKEVIELLEMMGGNNKYLYDGSDGFVYFIENFIIIYFRLVLFGFFTKKCYICNDSIELKRLLNLIKNVKNT